MTIAVVSCGGTIASTEQSGGDASPELSSNALVASVPELDDIAEFETHDFATIPSPDVTFHQMHDLVELIRELDTVTDVDGNHRHPRYRHS
jgi:L-asparaginase